MKSLGAKLTLQQKQGMAQEMRLNQYQQQSLHFLQIGVTELRSEIEELQEKHPELRWKAGAPEWEQGDVVLHQRKRYPGEWRLENQWQNGRFLSAEEWAQSSDAKQQMLENYTEDDGPELREVLREQIYLWDLPREDREFCELVLQNLDERGLNYENPLFIAKGSSRQKKRWAKYLQRIQELEPPGCACDSPLQSLTVQARLRFPDRLLFGVLQSLPSLEILGGREDFLAYLEKQGWNRLQAQNILRDLRELEPYPARGYRVANSRQNFRIYPELQVSADNGKIVVALLNNWGAQLEIAGPKTAPDSRQRQELEWLLQQLQRRETTLLRIAQSMFRFQQEFVLGGVRELRTMTLQMVADSTDFHVSTISRCVQGKYCKTPWGTYPLHFFFSRGADSGQSREQIKQRMVEIEQEYALSLPLSTLAGDASLAGNASPDGFLDSRSRRGKKLSDAELNRRLQNLGIQVARRTVAKYRAELRSEGRL
ncbi:MAG: hypothetical protein AAF975_00230 [Spirochaetota bacterium]